MRNFFLLAFIFLALSGCHTFQKQEKPKFKSHVLQEFEDQKNNQPVADKSKSGLSKKVLVKQIALLNDKVKKNCSCCSPSQPDCCRKCKLYQALKVEKSQKAKTLNEKKNNLSHKDKALKKNSSQSSCNLSNRSQKKINSYVVSITDNFLDDEHIEELLKMHLDDIKKSWPNKCPENCLAVNDYSIVAKAYPLSVNKNSCNKGESKETYQLSKSFFVKGKGADLETKKKLYKEAGNWLFSVFIKPFIPFSKNWPKEVKAYNIDKACPSCSFYLDYVYKYTTDKRLNLDVKARCGDRRKLISKFKSDFFLVNNWKCIEKD